MRESVFAIPEGWQAADGYTIDLFMRYGSALCTKAVGGTPELASYDFTILEAENGFIPVHGSSRMEPEPTLDAAAQRLDDYYARLPDESKLTCDAFDRIHQDSLPLMRLMPEAVRAFMQANPECASHESLINQGLCADFAHFVYHLGAKDLGARVINDIDALEDLPWPTIPSVEKSEFDRLGIASSFGHSWIESKGRHYDSETPYGTENFMELPTLRRAMVFHLEEHAPERLQELGQSSFWWKDSILDARAFEARLDQQATPTRKP